MASGEITETQALKFIFGHLLGGLAVLTQLNYFTIGLCFAIMPVVVAYPLAKRFTNYPQFVLGNQKKKKNPYFLLFMKGMTFNWGVVAGYTAIKGILDYQIVVPAYIG